MHQDADVTYRLPAGAVNKDNVFDQQVSTGRIDHDGENQ